MHSRAPEHDDFYENFCARMMQNLPELGGQLTAHIHKYRMSKQPYCILCTCKQLLCIYEFQ